MKPTEIKRMKKLVEGNSYIKQEFVNDPIAALEKYSAAFPPDNWIYRTIVLVLGIIILAITIGILIPYMTQSTPATEIPDILITIVSTALGALSGLLAPSPNDG